jgi:hypothetical protein
MNRRKVLKIGGLLGFSGLLSFSVYKNFFSFPDIKKDYFSLQKALLSELVDCIIPETDTPGAKQAEVHLFVIDVLENCASSTERRNFYKGIEELKSFCLSEYGKSFEMCNAEERFRVMAYFENSGKMVSGILGKIQKKVLGESFFNLLRKYTVNGYCTSFLGATQNLRYDYIPQTYEACISYKQGEPSWATK